MSSCLYTAEDTLGQLEFKENGNGNRNQTWGKFIKQIYALIEVFNSKI